MPHQIEKILALCERHFFARFSVNKKSGKHLKFGPVGELLRNNIYQEWFLASVIKAENVFPYHASELFSGNIMADVREPFTHSKFLTGSELPFGIAMQNSEVCPSVSENSDLENYGQQMILKICMFLNPEESTQYFDEWQQSRKVWWRKISAYPGRFALSDTEDKDGACQIQILAEFPWGKRSVETIVLNKSRILNSLDSDSKQVFEAKCGRKKVLPHVLTSSTNLENAVFTYLCDAYDETACMNISREIMRFHRKVAPYKTSFSISSSSTSVGVDLSELAEFLAKQLRNAGLSTLLLPDAAKKSLESQFVRNDELGIPFTVVMNDSTLKNGIVGLRSRDTTLKEQVHITDLKKYMLQLYENY